MNMNRYELREEVREKWIEKINEHIEKIERSSEPSQCILDLSDTEINPYTLGTMIEELGYDLIDNAINGWEMDFWNTYEKEGKKELQISGSGIIFELKLSGV